MPVRLRLPTRLPELISDDGVLLRRFIDGDEAAFEAIVKRHGRMVLGVCRRAIGDAHLAEDAFQAVFLVLAKRPQAALHAASLGGWLFGIARRVSLAAHRQELRRTKRERRAARPEAQSTKGWDDLLLVVDEELARLPEEDRASVIACFLNERTHDEAARELGWSVSTLRRRLDRGKELLRARLTRRGATLSAGLLAGLFAPSTATALPRELLERAYDAKGASRAVVSLASKASAGGAGGKMAAAMCCLAAAVGIALAFVSGEPPPIQHAVASPAVEVKVEATAPEPADAAQWFTITGQVLFPESRELPKRKEILKTDGFVKDAECCFADGRRLYFDDVIIDPKTRAIANAVVWLRPFKENPKAAFEPEKIHPKLRKPESKERVIDVVDCQFSPRITIARAGDTLLFKNSAPLATNIRYDAVAKGPSFPNGSFNVLLAAKTGSTKSPGPLDFGTRPDVFASSIYSWMKGYVWCFDHPYATVTDAEGKFRIPNAPVGDGCMLVIWHESFGFSGGHLYGTHEVIKPAPGKVLDLGKRIFEFKNDE